ncbi:efflux RND transporter periplasmic adaptor subunit [Gluconobacter sp. OJA]|uniref:efflux RND transporter periplasmic adaptor subunit n=1 Tax=Gluconobacter sp. OJA TaxID=3145197 RepID=UPI0031F74A96
MKKNLIRLVGPLLAVSVVSGCKKPSSAPQLPPQPVGVITLQPQPVRVQTELSGRLRAYEVAHIRPQVSGVILQRLFVEGQDVQLGQPLYQIDPRPYQAAYLTAKGALLRAQGNDTAAQERLRRYGPLSKEQAVSRQDYEEARAAAQDAEGQALSAKGDLQRASVDLEHAQVTSPISGRIDRSLVTAGTLTTAGQEQDLAVVTRLDPIYLDLQMPVQDLLRLWREMSEGRLHRVSKSTAVIDITLEDGTAYPHQGHLEFSEVNVDQTTGSIVTRAIIPNPEQRILPGMFVRARLDEGTVENGLLVPATALSHSPHGDPQVWIIDKDNKVQVRSVRTSQMIGTMWLVQSGLDAGERIMVSGFQKAQPGDKVTPQDVSQSARPQSENTSAGKAG